MRIIEESVGSYPTPRRTHLTAEDFSGLVIV